MTENEIHTGTEVRKQFDDISARDIKLVTAITRDPNPIHFDRNVVDQMGMPGLVNQGASNLSYLIQGIQKLTESYGDISDVEARFRNQVYEGDSLITTVTVEEVRENEDGWIADVSGRVEKEDGTVVVTGTATIGHEGR